VLFVDRLSPEVRLPLEPKLLGFESNFRKQQLSGLFPSDDEIKRQLKSLEQGLKSAK
jgi:hypothetical protein